MTYNTVRSDMNLYVRRYGSPVGFRIIGSFNGNNLYGTVEFDSAGGFYFIKGFYVNKNTIINVDLKKSKYSSKLSILKNYITHLNIEDFDL